MAITNNPNKTKTIEKRWLAEINRRWAGFTNAVEELPINSIVTNLDDREKNEVDAFLLGFDSLALTWLLAEPWQNKYQTQAYERSIERTNTEVKPQLTLVELQSAILISGTAISLLSIPVHRNELEFLHKRANDKLAGWIKLLSEEAAAILHDNYGTLANDELIDLIKKRISVSRSRAKVIAATEVAQAAQRAVINQAALISEATGVETLVRWLTVADSKVRHLHATWHGKLFTVKQALINITISPWNCRCGLKVIVKGRDPVRIKARFAKERLLLLSRELAAA